MLWLSEQLRGMSGADMKNVEGVIRVIKNLFSPKSGERLVYISEVPPDEELQLNIFAL